MVPQLLPYCSLASMLTAWCAVLGRYDWEGNHNVPWTTDLNDVTGAVDWTKFNSIT